MIQELNYRLPSVRAASESQARGPNHSTSASIFIIVIYQETTLIVSCIYLLFNCVMYHEYTINILYHSIGNIFGKFCCSRNPRWCKSGVGYDCVFQFPDFVFKCQSRNLGFSFVYSISVRNAMKNVMRTRQVLSCTILK